MKLKFKIQPYQTHAVESVVDCFTGQPNLSGIGYRMDPGVTQRASHAQARTLELEGFKNPDIQLSEQQLLQNILDVQKQQNLPLSDKLVSSPACKLNLDVEMETGTGKTYCFIGCGYQRHGD